MLAQRELGRPPFPAQRFGESQPFDLFIRRRGKTGRGQDSRLQARRGPEIQDFLRQGEGKKIARFRRNWRIDGETLRLQNDRPQQVLRVTRLPLTEVNSGLDDLRRQRLGPIAVSDRVLQQTQCFGRLSQLFITERHAKAHTAGQSAFAFGGKCLVDDQSGFEAAFLEKLLGLLPFGGIGLLLC